MPQAPPPLSLCVSVSPPPLDVEAQPCRLQAMQSVCSRRTLEHTNGHWQLAWMPLSRYFPRSPLAAIHRRSGSSSHGPLHTLDRCTHIVLCNCWTRSCQRQRHLVGSYRLRASPGCQDAPDGGPVGALPVSSLHPHPLSISETRARALSTLSCRRLTCVLDAAVACRPFSNMPAAIPPLFPRIRCPPSLSGPSCHYNLCPPAPVRLQTSRPARSIRYAPSIVRHERPAPLLPSYIRCPPCA